MAEGESKDDIQEGQRNIDVISKSDRDRLSPNSSAISCFTLQTFSRDLQTYLINYRNFTSSDYSITDE